MDIWSLAGFQGLKGMHSASPHYQGKTQPNQNGDEAEKKQEMAETAMGWMGGGGGGGYHVPILSLANIGWNQIPEVGICNNHANCQARLRSLDISDSFIILSQAFVLHIVTEFHTICITHSGTCNFVVYITVIHGYLWLCAIHSLSAFDCLVSWEADCEPAPAFLIQRQLMHLQFWTWWFGSTGQGEKKISATD